MAPTLYMVPPSPPVRAVQITSYALGVQLEEKVVNIIKQEHLTPEYLKINPQHTVPTFVEDDGFTVWDSHAINAYLVSKFGKDDSLYPKDLKKRAIVDQRLHFDSGVAFATGYSIIRPIVIGEKNTLTDADRQSLIKVYEFIEAFLDGKTWIAGESKTIADYAIYTTTTTSNVLVPIDDQKFPKLTAWLKKVDALPEAEVSKKGLAFFANMINSRLSK